MLVFQEFFLLFLLGLVKVYWPNIISSTRIKHQTQATIHMLRYLKVTLRILLKSRIFSQNCYPTRLFKYTMSLATKE